MNTIVDVAKAANVSVATVSKVFNGYKGVSERTRTKIVQVAKELDYFPSRSAAQLASGGSDSIGLILSMMSTHKSGDEYLLGLIAGIYDKAEKLGLPVTMFTASAILSKYENYVQFCHSNRLMGTIIHGLEMDDPNLQHLVNSQVPCVFIDLDFTGKRTSVISVENFRACREAVDILAGLGHKNIAFVSGSQSATVACDRLKGFKAGMKARGYSTPHILHSDFNRDSTYQLVKDYLLLHPDITAFFCASDLMAIGAMNACIDLGYRVPEDISVMGFDDVSFATHVRPQLSTIAQDFFTMGSTATSTLVDMYQGKQVDPYIYVPYQFHFRQSTAKNSKE